MEPRYQQQTVSRSTTQVDIDAGLRAHMLRVYNYMMIGLALTGAVALAITTVPALQQIFFKVVPTARGMALQPTILGFIGIFAPIALVFFLSFRVHAMSAAAAQATFWIYAALNGIAFSVAFMVYTSTSVAMVFFITAGMFGAMSLWGYTTKRDLSGMGSFLFMGLIGIIIASIVNIFVGSSALHFAISVIGVLIFTGLTAYDTQQIKNMYLEGEDSETAGKKAIMGALRLYLDFINMFWFLLQLFGSRE